MDLRKMEEFLSVVDAGQISAAADALYLSQSALSKRMASLSKELGVTLFTKTKTGIKLTPAGNEFCSYARKAVRDYHEVRERLAFLANGPGDTLRLGSLPLATEYGFEHAISSYWRDHPNIEIDYHEHSQDNLLKGLDLRMYDVVLARLDLLDKSRYEFINLYTDELVLICMQDHPLVHDQPVPLSSLRNERFVLLDERSDVTKVFQRHCVELGFYPSSPIHHTRHRMILKAVANKMGIGVLPRRLVETYYDENIELVSLSRPIETSIGLVWLKFEKLSPMVFDFIYTITKLMSS